MIKVQAPVAVQFLPLSHVSERLAPGAPVRGGGWGESIRLEVPLAVLIHDSSVDAEEVLVC